jgi:hypothetical protein
VDPDPVAADCLATALLVMGVADGGRWLAANPGHQAVLVRRSPGGVTEVLASAEALAGIRTTHPATALVPWPATADSCNPPTERRYETNRVQDDRR